MKRYIRSSQSFEDLNIRTYRLNTHLAPSPFKTCTEEEGQEVRQKLNQSDDAGTMQRCSMSTLITDQPVNQMSVLREMWEAAPSVEALEQIGNHLPLVAHYNGKDYLLDGNTRATLMLAMGADTLLCTYINLDDITARRCQ
ncbi:hypothetical protein [uncultured Duncaniella sp.]|uniref:hypothetical protein n=1 Tax=uncultured Duncaniella sp. TaxID=2768039 RepID=UPI002638B062|nr:hypothetical protein [uncultured Duncaniella sp.]